jgi:S-adenosyl methyltransferase
MPPGQEGDPAPSHPTREFDTSQAHPARVYDYWLGGKDNFCRGPGGCAARHRRQSAYRAGGASQGSGDVPQLRPGSAAVWDLDLAPPGIVQPHRWRPLPAALAYRGDPTAWCGVARKR